MQYQFLKKPWAKEVIFYNNNPLNNVRRIRYFQEEGIWGNFIKKEFRYSWDRATWTNWSSLSQNALMAIKFRDNPEFYLEIKYTRAHAGLADIESWYLFYDSDLPTPPGPPDVSINADTLCGQSCEFYLDRSNHFGPFLDIQMINLDSSGGIGVYSHREDSSLGSNFFFKNIKGQGSVLVSQQGDSIVVQGTTDASGNAVYYNPDPVVNTVGGIAAGETFFDPSSGRTFAETMEAMFYPTLYPTLTNPSNSFSNNAGSLREIGESVDITFTAHFDRGDINPAYGTSGNRSGLPNTYHYQGTGLPSSVSSTSLTDIQTITGYTVVKGNQTVWRSSVSYDAGEQPLDSKGNPYNSPLPAGTTTEKTVTFEGVYPLFATTVDINTLTKHGLVSMLSANYIEFNLVSESGGEKGKFEIPVAWLSSRALLGVQTYNEFSHNWEYQGGSMSSSLTYWTVSDVNETIQGNSIPYKRYTYNGTDRSGILIRIVF